MKLKKQYVPLLTILMLTVGCQTQQVQVTASQNKNQSTIEYAFTQQKQHPEKMLQNVIDNAKQTLDIAIYSLTKNEIVDSIMKAKKRGVNVRIITDHQEAQSKYQLQDLQKLIQAGIPIKQNTHKGLMHLKVTIADKSVLTTGSFNYSQAASTTNDEVLVVIHDPKMASEWTKEFDSMWNDDQNFEDVK